MLFHDVEPVFLSVEPVFLGVESVFYGLEQENVRRIGTNNTRFEYK
jgi:hypothetical protein